MKHKEFLQKVQLRNEQKLEAGLVSEHFPKVSGIVIQMTYFRKPANSVYMKRTVNMSPLSHAYFNMSCMIRRGYDRGLIKQLSYVKAGTGMTILFLVVMLTMLYLFY